MFTVDSLSFSSQSLDTRTEVVRILLCVLLLGISFSMGCSNEGAPAPTEEELSPEVTTEQGLKERLEYIAESGGMGSAMAGIVELAEKTGKADLIANAKKLESVSKPDAAKAIAKKMLEQL